MAQPRRRTPAIARPDDPQARAQFGRFPFGQAAAPAPANPVIGFRYGRAAEAAAPALVAAAFLAFPFFQAPPAAANAVIAFRYGRPLLEGVAPFILPQYLPYPYFQEAPGRPVIPFRYGRDVLAGEAVFLPLGYQRFPHVSTVPPPPANPVIGFRQRMLSELTALALGEIVSAPRYYPLVAPAPAPTEQPFREERFGKHWHRSGMRPT